MNKREIFEFLNAHPMFHLATVEEDRPRVRGMLLYRADENGIIFNTGKVKDLHKQLTENPHVEMCFTDTNFESLRQVRVSGTVELVEDLDLKKEIIGKREFLKPWIEQVGYEPLAVYRMRKATATVWTLATNFASKEFIELLNA
ncbi:MAG: pyridoxamine 5'-phosphate oxidase family protein [Alphaproteobacteria bacterium]|uniref:Pyridoxamine 5'-phosphate oxidase family protein n=1 Tax=Candidatus Nitrobium versatile TaxID=2884831 RepID=A0A953J9B9_9BACT|nr:pyridoxamine 5'-phosphate oxidase family protein [Candidatus Nitrobium versatile]